MSTAPTTLVHAEDLRPQPELLCKAFPVIHRANHDLVKREAFVRLAYKMDAIVLEFGGAAAATATTGANNNKAEMNKKEIRIPLKCVQNLRPKDFSVPAAAALPPSGFLQKEKSDHAQKEKNPTPDDDEEENKMNQKGNKADQQSTKPEQIINSLAAENNTSKLPMAILTFEDLTNSLDGWKPGTGSYIKNEKQGGGFLQRSLQFSGRETRDLWFFGLKEILQQRMLQMNTERKLPVVQPWAIDELMLSDPVGAETDYYCQVQNKALGAGGKSATFALKKQVNLKDYMENSLWTDVMTFLDDHSIVPSEGLSLF
ncbi:unnamed protein product, partial [Amoebophrya sp. A120]|eukprot:GSA120T00022440001.1